MQRYIKESDSVTSENMLQFSPLPLQPLFAGDVESFHTIAYVSTPLTMWHKTHCFWLRYFGGDNDVAIL
jgi:hypothetical protein